MPSIRNALRFSALLCAFVLAVPAALTAQTQDTTKLAATLGSWRMASSARPVFVDVRRQST